MMNLEIICTSKFTPLIHPRRLLNRLVWLAYVIYIDLTPENLLLVLCDASSYHDSCRFRPEDVKIHIIKSV
jgi:hypothetical protein